jgi:glucan phosphoethanolaminetransferase (alkaline phosphatase superfamily)
MLQRIQTVWLLLAAVCGFTSLKTSFFIGSIGAEPANHLTAMSNIWLMILTIVSATIAVVSIFMYKNRALQLKLVLSTIALSVIILVLYFTQTQKYAVGGFALTSLIAVAVPVLLIMAATGIYKDEKLVKSVDRIR